MSIKGPTSSSSFHSQLQAFAATLQPPLQIRLQDSLNGWIPDVSVAPNLAELSGIQIAVDGLNSFPLPTDGFHRSFSPFLYTNSSNGDQRLYPYLWFPGRDPHLLQTMSEFDNIFGPDHLGAMITALRQIGINLGTLGLTVNAQPVLFFQGDEKRTVLENLIKKMGCNNWKGSYEQNVQTGSNSSSSNPSNPSCRDAKSDTVSTASSNLNLVPWLKREEIKFSNIRRARRTRNGRLPDASLQMPVPDTVAGSSFKLNDTSLLKRHKIMLHNRRAKSMRNFHLPDAPLQIPVPDTVVVASLLEHYKIIRDQRAKWMPKYYLRDAPLQMPVPANTVVDSSMTYLTQTAVFAESHTPESFTSAMQLESGLKAQCGRRRDMTQDSTEPEALVPQPAPRYPDSQYASNNWQICQEGGAISEPNTLHEVGNVEQRTLFFNSVIPTEIPPPLTADQFDTILGCTQYSWMTNEPVNTAMAVQTPGPQPTYANIFGGLPFNNHMGFNWMTNEPVNTAMAVQTPGPQPTYANIFGGLPFNNHMGFNTAGGSNHPDLTQSCELYNDVPHFPGPSAEGFTREPFNQIHPDLTQSWGLYNDIPHFPGTSTEDFTWEPFNQIHPDPTQSWGLHNYVPHFPGPSAEDFTRDHYQIQ